MPSSHRKTITRTIPAPLLTSALVVGLVLVAALANSVLRGRGPAHEMEPGPAAVRLGSSRTTEPTQATEAAVATRAATLAATRAKAVASTTGSLAAKASATRAAIAASKASARSGGTKPVASRSSASKPSSSPRAPSTTPKVTGVGVQKSKLKAYAGDLWIREDGTVIDGLDVQGVIVVRASNVTIRNTRVHGATSTSTGRALISNYEGRPGLLIEDTTIAEDHANPFNSAGIQGWNFVARRVHISGMVDNIGIYGSNVTVENSLLDRTVYYSSHRSQGGGPSHSDGIQIAKGDNILLRGNRIYGSANFALVGSAEQGPTRNLRVIDNYMAGGHCTMKFSAFNGNANSATVSGNRIGRGQKVGDCAMVVVTGFNASLSGNTWSDTGRAVVPTRTAS